MIPSRSFHLFQLQLKNDFRIGNTHVLKERTDVINPYLLSLIKYNRTPETHTIHRAFMCYWRKEEQLDELWERKYVIKYKHIT